MSVDLLWLIVFFWKTHVLKFFIVYTCIDFLSCDLSLHLLQYIHFVFSFFILLHFFPLCNSFSFTCITFHSPSFTHHLSFAPVFTHRLSLIIFSLSLSLKSVLDSVQNSYIVYYMVYYYTTLLCKYVFLRHPLPTPSQTRRVMYNTYSSLFLRLKYKATLDPGNG